jgi:hypothetical protein
MVMAIDLCHLLAYFSARSGYRAVEPPNGYAAVPVGCPPFGRDCR